jgi:ABC-2 type transport system ATP-binding protein
MITVKEVSIQFASVLAIDNISITLQDGTLYGIVGPNGAGKSTLIRTMVGMISEYSGEILYDGLSLEKNRQVIKEAMGYAPEDIELMPFLTGQEYLHMLADIRKIVDFKSDIKDLLEKLGLQEVKDIIIDRYSHGMRQKLSLAAALIGSPKNILLDEALNGLDPFSMFNIKNILERLANEGHIILLSSHILELIENLSHEIIILNRGKLITQLSQREIQHMKSKHGKGFNDYFIELVQPRDLH